MLIKFLRFLLGWVRFRVKGEFPERFLNQLAQNHISVWDFKRRAGFIEASAFMKDYRKFHILKAKNRVVTKVLKRCGLTVIIKKHRLRVGLALGGLLYFAILFLLSSCIWNVRVVGNQNITTAEILNVCEQLGLHEGARRSSLDTNLLRVKLALELDGIAWASINIEGVRATINISESDKTEKNTSQPCNLVAEFDGVITATEVTDGNIKIKIGQTVKKGDLLVSGVTEYKDGMYRFGVSAGKVMAETERELRCFVPFAQSKIIRCGEPQKRSVITFFGLNVPLYLGSVKTPYQTESSTTQFEKDGMYLPIKLTETLFFKTETVNFNLSEQEAKKKAEQELALSEEKELKNAEILSKSVQFEVKSDGVWIISKYKCKQNIAKTDLLLILDEK